MKNAILFLHCLMATTLTYAGDVPDLSKTPGSVRPGLTKTKICSIKWGRDERHVTEPMKRKVFEN